MEVRATNNEVWGAKFEGKSEPGSAVTASFKSCTSISGGSGGEGKKRCFCGGIV
jgi:hypothetical protein